MNSKNKNIKITFETKDYNNFSYLDVRITRKNKRFVTTIFCKAKLSTYKRVLVHMLLLWFPKTCSSKENFLYRSRTPEKHFEM